MTSQETQPIAVLSLDDLSTDGKYTLGMRWYYTAEGALDAAEQQCYNGNRLTAPFRGIETRNSVFFDGEYYRTLIYPIEPAQSQG